MAIVSVELDDSERGGAVLPVRQFRVSWRWRRFGQALLDPPITEPKYGQVPLALWLPDNNIGRRRSTSDFWCKRYGLADEQAPFPDHLGQRPIA